MKLRSLAKLTLFCLAASMVLASGCGQSELPREHLSASAIQTSEDAGLFCKEHGVPEKFCTICHPELKGKLLLCKEHGDIPEDICTLCHPEVEKKHSLVMCPKGHGLPEHFCTECANKPSA